MVKFSFHLLNEEIKCYIIMDLYFCPGQRKPYIDTILQEGRESTIFSKPGKKIELYIFCLFLSKKKKKILKNPLPVEWRLSRKEDISK